MIKKPLGGERLGAGGKMMVEMKSYSRSTHNLSKIVRGTMAPGVLYPIYNRPAQNGDTWDGHIQAIVNTHPTVGPLFGTFDFAVHVFCTPVRIYNSWLNNNKLNIGLSMSSVKLPQLELRAIAKAVDTIKDNDQMNASCIDSLQGIKGIGRMGTGYSAGDIMTRQFNAIPRLAYWDIFKNYFANKQETDAWVIHSGDTVYPVPPIIVHVSTGGGTDLHLGKDAEDELVILTIGATATLNYPSAPAGPQIDAVKNIIIVDGDGNNHKFLDIFSSGPSVVADTLVYTMDNPGLVGTALKYYTTPDNNGIQLTQFPLKNIDDMRELILATPGNTALIIDHTSEAPYSLPMQIYNDGVNDICSSTQPMEGLAVKTYKNDLLNNWIQTETQTFISETSAISTISGTITVDQIILSNKVYNILNRIAISGGSYDDWEETVYTSGVYRKAYSPIYCGGLMKEITFGQVVSTATTQTDGGGQQPLGQLGGKGHFGGKHKGGQIQIKPREWSYITAIAVITPNIDYSQGNDWCTHLQTMDDFHKPELDQIGFQDLTTEQMAWFDTVVNSDGTVVQKSAGKQPAWVNYMTDINSTYGNFAEPLNEMFMTLNRRYEISPTDGSIVDITTYIDPTKYNYIFAETKLDAQNFWVQVGFNWEVRRVMSAKIIPNL